MIKDGQVRKLWRELDGGWKLAVSARRAGMDEKTARKYRDGRKLPSTLRQPRTYRTRKRPMRWPTGGSKCKPDGRWTPTSAKTRTSAAFEMSRRRIWPPFEVSRRTLTR